jgi:hypothetical protein
LYKTNPLVVVTMTILLSSFKTCHLICSNNNTTGFLSRAETVLLWEAPQFIPVLFCLFGRRRFHVAHFSFLYCGRQFVVWPFPFGHCIVCLSSIYYVLLSLWYFHTLVFTPTWFYKRGLRFTIMMSCPTSTWLPVICFSLV